jgi:hypothetical protein
VRHSQISSGNTPPMTRTCIPFYKPLFNGNITFLERRQSSTLITSLCSPYIHKVSCKKITIKSGPHTYNSSILTSSIRQGAQIVSFTASVDLMWIHSPSCSIHVGTRHLVGPNFIIDILTSPPAINSWVHAQMSLIFTFRIDSYAIWNIFLFLQASMQS